MATFDDLEEHTSCEGSEVDILEERYVDFYSQREGSIIENVLTGDWDVLVKVNGFHRKVKISNIKDKFSIEDGNTFVHKNSRSYVCDTKFIRSYETKEVTAQDDEYKILPILTKHDAEEALPELTQRFETICGDFMKQLDERQVVSLVSLESFLRSITMDAPESELKGTLEKYIDSIRTKRKSVK